MGPGGRIICSRTLDERNIRVNKRSCRRERLSHDRIKSNVEVFPQLGRGRWQMLLLSDSPHSTGSGNLAVSALNKVSALAPGSTLAQPPEHLSGQSRAEVTREETNNWVIVANSGSWGGERPAGHRTDLEPRGM